MLSAPRAAARPLHFGPHARRNGAPRRPQPARALHNARDEDDDDCPFDALGVSPSASDDEIKRAFRKRAKE